MQAVQVPLSPGDLCKRMSFGGSKISLDCLTGCLAPPLLPSPPHLFMLLNSRVTLSPEHTDHNGIIIVPKLPKKKKKKGVYGGVWGSKNLTAPRRRHNQLLLCQKFPGDKEGV